MSFLTIQFKLLASALELTRENIVDIVALGGIQVSKSRVDGWKRSSSATKNATGNSDMAGKQISRSKEISQDEFHAFCVGLKPWLDLIDKKD